MYRKLTDACADKCSHSGVKIMTLTVLLILSTPGYAQFAVVRDPDGFCNVRSNPVIDPGNVIDKLSNGDVVYCQERSGNWIEVEYRMSGETHSGYMYYDRLIDISKYQAFDGYQKKPDEIILSTDKIAVVVKRRRFNPKAHELVYNPEKYLATIDGGEVWGEDGDVPKQEYKSIHVTYNDKDIYLPRTAMQNLYGPNLNQTKAYYDHDGRAIYIESSNGDGAGGYSVIWRIVDGKYTDRFVLRGF